MLSTSQNPSSLSSSIEPFSLKTTEEIEKAPSSKVTLSGSDSLLFLSTLLSDPYHLNKWPHLVIVPSEKEADLLIMTLKSFDPLRPYFKLVPFDVSVYSGFYPHPQRICQRLRWLYKAQNAKPGDIFITSMEAFLQKTISFQALSQNVLLLKKGLSLPTNFLFSLAQKGYVAAPLVEEMGQFASRGGIIDIFSPAYNNPIRLELFGDQIDDIRFFDPENQKSLSTTNEAIIIPAKEVLFDESTLENVVKKFISISQNQDKTLIRKLSQKEYFHGIEFLVPYFYSSQNRPIEHFSSPLYVWHYKEEHSLKVFKERLLQLEQEKDTSLPLFIPHEDLYASPENLPYPESSKRIFMEKISFSEKESLIQIDDSSLDPFLKTCKSLTYDKKNLFQKTEESLKKWRKEHNVFICTSSQLMLKKLQIFFEQSDLSFKIAEKNDFSWRTWQEAQNQNPHLIHLVPHSLISSSFFPQEHLLFLRGEDLLGAPKKLRTIKKETFSSESSHFFSFSDISPNDLVVHKLHGIGVFKELKTLSIREKKEEFIIIEYKDGDKLFLPVDKINLLQKYSGPESSRTLDKLGGSSWSK
ncbi:MAG: hypothetical protein D6797_05035, partial [Bdellovibrio sp.]